MQTQFLVQCISLANTANTQGQYDVAISWCRQALQLVPDLPEAWYNLGLALGGQGKIEKAVAALLKTAALSHSNPEAQNSIGLKFIELGAYSEAEACLERSLALAPDYAFAHFNRGGLMAKQYRPNEAAAAFRKAIALEPNLADAYYHLGNTLIDLKQPKAALIAFDNALALRPDYKFLPGTILNTKRLMCEWRDDSQSLEGISHKVHLHEKACTPFVFLGLIDSLGQQREVAELAAKECCPEKNELGQIAKRYNHDKIRIGYYSADFHSHATAYLMAELFELHDRAKFELVGFAFGPDKHDEMRQRLSVAFDRFIDVRNMSDKAVAQLSRELEIDIAVDLKGHTLDGRTGIFSYRAAPIQVNYLGYPGTMGVSFIDYIIADKTLISIENLKHYSEKVVYLPNSYQVNDAKRQIADRVFFREELGLPETGFVYCCFNNNHKITPTIFDSWMRILRQVDNSVFWLLEDNPVAAENLRKEARQRDIDPDRLIFANRRPLPEHLSRQRAADLFLDTLPYNAHTTASDALWVGLPVLTQTGESFASRVAASLLNAIGLPELITTNKADYEALAIGLAASPDKLAQLKRKLEQNRLTTPLFNARLFTNHIEAAYMAMYECYQSDSPAADIFVEQ